MKFYILFSTRAATVIETSFRISYLQYQSATCKKMRLNIKPVFIPLGMVQDVCTSLFWIRKLLIYGSN